MTVIVVIKQKFLLLSGKRFCYTLHMPNQTRTLSVLLATDFSRTSGRDFAAGVLRYARDAPRWRLTIAQSPGEFTSMRLKAAAAGGVDGIITTLAESADIRQALRRADVPVVLAGGWHDFLKAHESLYSIVVVDEEKIGAVGAEHLLSLGRFASFGFVHCPEKRNRLTSVSRKRGFRKALARHGYACRSFDRADDGAALTQWLRSLPKPAGILAGHDRAAKAVLEACLRSGLKVPEKASVLGIDNDVLLCESAHPSLSSIHIDPESLGFAAASALARHFRRRTAGTQGRQIVSTRIKVVERDSTHHVAPAAHLIEKAVAYIDAHKESAIAVKDVVAHLGVSRRLIDLRFRQYAGETVLQAITRARLDAASARIAKSSGSISQAIRPLDFPDVSWFSALFKRRFGLSPAAWRRKQQGG